MPAEVKKEVQLEIAHVLFVDIVGYSKLLINEQHAAVDELTQIVRATEQFQKAEASERLIKIATGDGMALVFYTSPDTPVRCAMEISRVLKEHPRLRVRMGIHSGPVSGVIDVTGRANLTGSGLNMANRVMSCGDAGHILLSKHIAEDLEEYGEWRPLLHDLGTCEVKHGVRIGVANFYDAEIGNSHLPSKLHTVKKHRTRVRFAEVTAALLLFAAIIAGLIFFLRRPTGPALPILGKSIAVLPFENLSEDKGNAYFVTGIQDEILTRLANLRELKVISRTSTEKYPSRPQNLKAIAAELGVATLLEGTVQKLANEAHINVQLINAFSGAHIWAQSYDRTLEHVFGVEGEVAQSIADALKLKLLPAQIDKLNALPTQNPKAYDLFLKGEYMRDRAWKSGGYEQTLEPAIACYREAVTLDPQFALAFAQLAETQLTEYYFGIIDYSARRMPELLTSAKNNIDRALHLEPDLPAAHAALGRWHRLARSDYDAALAEYKRALAVNPRLVDAGIGIAAIAMRRGRPWEAIGYLSKMLEFDPRNPLLLRHLATNYRMRKDYARSVELLSRAVALDPASVIDAVNLSQSIIRESGDIRSASNVLDAVPVELQKNEAMVENRVWLSMFGRDFMAAEKMVESLPPENWRSSWNRPLLLGKIQRALGQEELARESFQQARTLLIAAIAKDPEEPLMHADLAQVDAGLGLEGEALREADRAIDLQPIDKDAFVGPQWLANWAEVNAQLGRTDEAIKLIERLLAMPNDSLCVWELKLDPVWDPLRGESRFERLIASPASNESTPK